MTRIVNPVGVGHSSRLPQSVKALDGDVFNPRDNTWVIRSSTLERRFHFSKIQRSASIELLEDLKLAAVWFLENRSLSHAFNVTFQTIQFVEWIVHGSRDTVTQIRNTDILNYRACLAKHTVWYLGSARVLLLKMCELGFRSVDASAANLLNELTIQGNRKAVAVLTHDPVQGPFTDIELDGIIRAVTAAYEIGHLAHPEFCMFWLFCLLGPRPVQIAMLKVKDYRLLQGNGVEETFLFVPSAKRRAEKPRESMMPRSLNKDVSRMVERQVALVVQTHRGMNIRPEELPLFPTETGALDTSQAGFELHATANEIGRRLTGVFDTLDVLSERTGEQIRINATRFRRTVATRAAVRGYNEFVIAELLDHTDTQNARVYIEARPEMVDRIDAAIAHELAALSNAFQGIVIERTDERVSELPDENTIADVRFDKTAKPFASCVQMGSCGFDAPVACYLCISFRPWVDGPHEKVLQYLIEQRDEHLKAGRKEVAKVNDRTIIAVAQVIRQCNDFKARNA